MPHMIKCTCDFKDGLHSSDCSLVEMGKILGGKLPSVVGGIADVINHPTHYTFGKDVGSPISKEELLEYRAGLFKKLDGVLVAKGNDYNSEQQESGDTLFNLRVSAILGITKTPIDGILVRLSDKLMRLVSLTRPAAVQKVKDESIEDTIGDAINYLTYVGAMLRKKAS